MLGLVATLILIALSAYFKIPNPAPVCLTAIVFSTFIGGYIYGVISGLATVVYCLYFFSIPGKLFYYTSDNLYRMGIILLVVPIMILIVGSLKNSVDKRTKELEEANRRLNLLSTIDSLTGIPNRRFFDQSMIKEWRRAQRDQQKLTVAMIDIDFFKYYNDTYGHQEGDNCLNQVAYAIAKEARRPGDLAARYGGEEFALILPNTDISGAVALCEAIRRSVQMLAIPHQASLVNPSVTVSIGVATVVPCENMSPCHLIKLADQSLYKAKENGRDKVEVCII
jgi:diguanylate cyclase (GGDEF)-like protein